MCHDGGMNNPMTPDRLADVLACIPPDWTGMRRLVFEAIQEWRNDREMIDGQSKTIESLQSAIQYLHNTLEDASPVSQEE